LQKNSNYDYTILAFIFLIYTTINIPQHSENSNKQNRDKINSEIFSNLSKETPLLDSSIDIHIPIE